MIMKYLLEDLMENYFYMTYEIYNKSNKLLIFKMVLYGELFKRKILLVLHKDHQINFQS